MPTGSVIKPIRTNFYCLAYLRHLYLEYKEQMLLGVVIIATPNTEK